MIEQGDGAFQRRLNNSQCPRCRSLITLRRDDEHKREYECTGCKLKIIDIKGESD
jgi:DNA-directed RNA polymerase subunit RPC12/RpoP